MRDRAFHLALALAVCLGQLVPPALGWSGLELCIGGDGHVAIEPAHDAPGCEELCEGRDGPRRAADDDDGEDAHGCLDLELSPGPWQARIGPPGAWETTRDALLAAPAGEIVPVPAAAIVAVGDPDPPRIRDARLRSLSTVILRT